MLSLVVDNLQHYNLELEILDEARRLLDYDDLYSDSVEAADQTNLLHAYRAVWPTYVDMLASVDCEACRLRILSAESEECSS